MQLATRYKHNNEYIHYTSMSFASIKDNRKISPPAAIVAAKPILSYRGDESISARGKSRWSDMTAFHPLSAWEWPKFLKKSISWLCIDTSCCNVTRQYAFKIWAHCAAACCANTMISLVFVKCESGVHFTSFYLKWGELRERNRSLWVASTLELSFGVQL